MNISDLKTGTILLHNEEPWQIIWSNHQRSAQGKPVMQTKLRNLISGKVIEYSFKYGEKVDEADIVKEKANFLYADPEGTHFMSAETFETIDIAKDITKTQEKFLKEGFEVQIVRFNENPVGIELPIKVDLEVIESPPDVKGNSGGNITKPIKLETGITVNAPMFIKVGDIVRVDTRDGQYEERVKN